MSSVSQPNWAALAREALAELGADEPDLSVAELMGGPLAWGESDVGLFEAQRDPKNVNVMRPHLIAACQKLDRHPAIRLHCSCGKGLDWLALAPLSTGVLVVSSPRHAPYKQQGGGILDLAPVEEGLPADAGWSLIPWEESMLRRDAQHRSSWQRPEVHPVLGPNVRVIGDAVKRQTFICPKCDADFVFLNVQLLRLFLQAIAARDKKIRLADREIKATTST